MQNQLHRHYILLLGLETPWKVANVDLQIEASRVVIQVEHNGTQEPCIECAKNCNIKDHAAVRQWRHLDTMNFETVIKARTPRTNCVEYGVKTVAVPWAEKSFLRGHNYITLLNDLDGGRVLDVVPERTEKACRELIVKALPTDWSRFKIEAIAMDM